MPCHTRATHWIRPCIRDIMGNLVALFFYHFKISKPLLSSSLSSKRCYKFRFHSGIGSPSIAHPLCNYGAHQPRTHCWCFLSFRSHLVTWSWSIQFSILLKQGPKISVHCCPQFLTYFITKHYHSCHLDIIRKLEPRVNSNTEKIIMLSN